MGTTFKGNAEQGEYIRRPADSGDEATLEGIIKCASLYEQKEAKKQMLETLVGYRAYHCAKVVGLGPNNG